MKNLSELVAGLQTRPVEVTLEPAPTAVAVTTNVSEVPGYVRPEISNVFLPERSKVLLLEAAGAVGKSAAAKFVANNRRWILVDSSQLQVGDYGLTGLFHRVFDKDLSFWETLRRGDVGIVIDALDEAHLKAGTSNFFAFLEDVVTVAKTSAASGIGIVLLSRPDTAEYVRLKFEELNEPLGRAVLEFFSAEAARAYVSSYLENAATLSTRASVETRNLGGYVSLREERFRTIASVLLGEAVESVDDRWSDVRSFLGYAPVLGILAETLDVSNPFKEAQDQRSMAEASVSVLSELVQSLLVREQQKFIAQVGEDLEASWPAALHYDSSFLYPPSDQVARLACKMFDLSEDPVSPVPAALAPEYDTRAVQWISDHPFVSGNGAVNSVFRDYVAARATAEPATAAAMAKVSYLPGPFYFRFSHEFRAVNGFSEIEENLVPVMASSAIAAGGGESLSWIFSQQSNEAYLELFDPFSQEFLLFVVAGLSGLLELGLPLQKCLITTDESIRVAAPSGMLEIIGPTYVSGREIEISASTIFVASGRAAIFSPEWTAGEVRSISAAPGARLEVFGADSWPVFRTYHVDASNFVMPVDPGIYVDLRSIFRWFRRQAGKRVGVYGEKLEQLVVKNNARRRTMLDALLRADVLEKVADHYVVNVAILSSHGVSVKAIVSGVPSPEIRAFVKFLLGESTD